jgi:diguanylate cyclase (GGDEF)-like protein/PAS domain S-box-containing protein
MGAPADTQGSRGPQRGLPRPAAAFTLVGLAVTAAYAVRAGALLDAVLVVAVTTAAAMSLAVSAVRRPAGHRLPWGLLAAAQAVWAGGWVAWEAHIVRLGTAPSPGTGADLVFLAGDALMLVALALLFRTRKFGGQLLLDTLLVAGAVALVAWPTLVGPYLETTTLPAIGRTTQIAYALVDAAILGLLVRGYLWRRHDRTLNLVAAGMSCYLVADLTWNWLTLTGHYVAGSTYDLGWVLFSVFLGAAGLMPARAAEERAPAAGPSLSRGAMLLLALSGLTAPAVLAFERLATGGTSLPVLIGGSLLSLVVVCRLLVVVGRAERLSLALYQADRRFRSLVENLPLVSYVDEVDERSSNIYTSPQITALCGYTPEEWQADPDLFVKLLHPDDREATLARQAECVATGEGFEGEYRLMTRSGGIVWVRDQSTIVRDDDGNPLHAQGYLLDITGRRAAEDEAEQLAFHDPLTGLANRLRFERELAQSLEQCSPDGTGVAVLYVDLDDFKLVNDSFGHQTGDLVLCRVADSLRVAASEVALVARQGGDEFLLLLEAPVAELSGVAVDVAERIRAALRRPLPVGPIEITASGSIGISLYPLDGQDGSTLLKHADSAMYTVKQHGRDAYRRYAGEADDALNKLDLVSRLRGAIDRDELHLLYQPIVDLQSGRIVSAEALLRWHPDGAVIPPTAFIPLAEHTGLIRPMTHWIIDEVSAAIRFFVDQGLHLPVAINVSPAAFDAGLPARLLEAADRHGIDHRLLGVEITESGIMDDPDQANSVVEALARHGIPVSIDDFGTGHSSLSRLAVLPVKTLKIDRSFINDLNRRPSADAIVASIVQLAAALGRVPLAEGIETPEQHASLVARGCKLGQGFLFSRPIEAAELARLAGADELAA